MPCKYARIECHLYCVPLLYCQDLNMTIRQDVIDAFRMQFLEAPTLVVRAPGRVNLIGVHTDYNDGFVMPLAIDRAVWIALRPRHDTIVRVSSLDFEAPITFSLENIVRHKDTAPT